jgi:hypothetical protein
MINAASASTQSLHVEQNSIVSSRWSSWIFWRVRKIVTNQALMNGKELWKGKLERKKRKEGMEAGESDKVVHACNRYVGRSCAQVCLRFGAGSGRCMIQVLLPFSPNHKHAMNCF